MNENPPGPMEPQPTVPAPQPPPAQPAPPPPVPPVTPPPVVPAPVPPAPPPATTPVSVAPPATTDPPPTSVPPGPKRFDGVKSFVIKILIACLVAAAGLAVVAVLFGGFSEILGRAITTLVLVAVHAVIALTYISTNDEPAGSTELSIFSNSVFAVIVLSFITSVLGTWELLDGDLVTKLYATYGVLLFAILHGEMLAKTMGKTSTIDNIVRVNYLFMLIVVLLIMPVIYINWEGLPGMYWRVLSALGIVDATLTILAVALHRLYLNKHPEEASKLFENGPGATVAPGQPAKPAARHTNPLLLLVGVYIIGQIIVSVVMIFAGGLGSL